MINRRDFLRLAGWAGAALAIPQVKPGRFWPSPAYGAEKSRTFSGS